MKTFVGLLLLISGLATYPCISGRADESANSPRPAPAFSGAINDVVKLAQSGVDESVVVAFIKNSPGPFQPTADEILKLRDQGISSDVITAMLERGSELRRQVPPSPPAPYPSPSPAAPAPAAQPSATYSETAPAETTSAEPASSVIYIGSSYPVYSYYPYYTYYPYYSYYWCYPWGYGGYYPYHYYGYYPYHYWSYYHHPDHHGDLHHGFAFLPHPNYYPWYRRDDRFGHSAPHGVPDGRRGVAPHNGNFHTPMAAARPSNVRVIGNRSSTFASPRPVGMQMASARVMSGPRFAGGGSRPIAFANPRFNSAPMSAPRIVSAPRMGGMPMAGARFGGGMRHR